MESTCVLNFSFWRFFDQKRFEHLYHCCHFEFFARYWDIIFLSYIPFSTLSLSHTHYSPSAAVLDIILSFGAWRGLKFNQILRYLLKFAVAAFWVVVMPVTYSKSFQNPTGIMRFFNNLGADWLNQSLYNYCVAIYLIPNLLAAFLFLIPFLRRSMERSNWRIINLLLWWSQVSPYNKCFLWL